MLAINIWFIVTCLSLIILQITGQACAQFTDPHAYDNCPIGINQLELRYAFVHANASIDTSLIVGGAKLNLNEGTIDYTRYFGWLHRLMWVEASVPVAGLSGSIRGTNIRASSAGTGDSGYSLGVLLKGGPALNVAQFENYKPVTILGVNLTITAPTGSYESDKILNLGSARWAFRPEFALSHPFGSEQKWQVDAYANVDFYTDNTSYQGKQILRQNPLPGVEGHISYSFTDSVWASLDTRYSFRGTTFVNGVTQDDAQQNFILGNEINISLNPRNSLVFVFAKALVHHNGPAEVGFSVRYDYTWGKDYR